jgi:LPXTG-motif cell wall-anchored protein
VILIDGDNGVTKRIDVTVIVDSRSEGGSSREEEGPVSKVTGSNMLWFYLLIFIIIAIVVLFFIFKRRKKREDEKESEEELDAPEDSENGQAEQLQLESEEPVQEIAASSVETPIPIPVETPKPKLPPAGENVDGMPQLEEQIEDSINQE